MGIWKVTQGRFQIASRTVICGHCKGEVFRIRNVGYVGRILVCMECQKVEWFLRIHKQHCIEEIPSP